MKNILPRRTVLITGGAGFIGANLVRRLIELDYKATLILRKFTDIWRIKDILDKVKICYVDILNKKDLTAIVRKVNPNFIVHLATFSDYRKQENVEEMVDNNIKGTLNLLLASKDIDYKLFINTGSSSEYGIKRNPMIESDLLEPISFYAATKASATHLCKAFSLGYKKPITTVRPFSVYGPYEDPKRFIPTIIKSFIKKESIKLTPGNQRRDFIYIEDIVDLYIKSMNQGKKISGEILNFGTGIEYTNDQVVRTLFKIAKKSVPVEKGAYSTRMWDTPHWVANLKLTSKILNWKPKFSLEEGLRKTYFWYKKNERF